MSMFGTLWNDEQGFLVSAELILIATLVVIGLIVGLSCLHSALVFELKDIAFALTSLNQSYRFPGFHGCKGSWVPGSFHIDRFGLRPYQNAYGVSDIGVGGYGLYGGGSIGGGGYSVPGPAGMHLDLPESKTEACPPGTECPPASVPAPDAGCTDCTPGYPEPTGPITPQQDSYPMLYSPGQVPSQYGY